MLLLLVAREILAIKSCYNSVIRHCHWERWQRKHKRHSELWTKAKTTFQNGCWIKWRGIEGAVLLKAYILSADVLFSSITMAGLL